MSKEPIWVPLKDLLHVLKEYDMWSLDTKYLHIYLDTLQDNPNLVLH